MGNRLKKRAISPILKILILVAIVGVLITTILTVVMSLAGLPTILPVFIGVLLHIVVFLIAYILCNKIIHKVSRKIGKDTIRSLASSLKKVTATLLIISILLDIILGLTVGIGLGGDNYWHNQAAMIEQMMERIREKKEKDKYDWGLEYDQNANEQNWNNGSVIYTDEAQTLVEIALAEARYYDENKIKGGHKYWNWLSGLGYGCAQYSYNGELGWDWCASFVTWCVYQAGLASSTDPDATFGDLLHNCWNVRGCEAWKDYLDGLGWDSHKSGEGYEPKPGDIALFYYKNGKNPGFGHIGIVEKTENGKVYTIEGNVNGKSKIWPNDPPYCFTSKVKNDSFGESRKGGYTLYYTPPYKKSAVSGDNYTPGTFNIGNYERGSNGYYTAESVEQIMYDFFRIEMGYNNAAAAGALANLKHECSFGYDKMEVANEGKAYYSKNKNDKFLRVANTYGNGNWNNIPDIENTLNYTGVLYYYRASKNDYVKYGMGFGIVQWSFGRRVSMFKYCENNGYGNGKGPDSLYGQLMYLKYELENSYSGVNATMKSVPNTAEGARTAALKWASSYEVCRESDRPARGNEAVSIWWPKYGNKNPSSNYSPGTSGGIKAGTTDISNCTIIGDSNTVRMSSYGTTITKAKKVLATVGVGVGSWDSLTKSGTGETTIPGLTLKQAINKLSSDDLSHVVIMLGTNDSSSDQSNFTTNYKSVLDYIKSKNSNAVVTICTIPPVNDDKSPSIKNTNASNTSGYIKSIASSYTGLKVELLDVNSYLSSSDMSTADGDGYHLSASGATKCANYIASNCH